MSERTAESSRAGSVALREWFAIGLITLLAVVARTWSFHAAGIVQYDEGVYAFTGLGLTDPSQPFRMYPEQEKFSPPFYFSMVALSYLVHGPSDLSAILVNVVLGTLSIPVLWWFVRRHFGVTAAAVAATLLAFDPTHLTLSRSALTDVSFSLNFVLALAALAWALESGRTFPAVVAGLATGLAWNTKYHGWFAGVIAIGAVSGMYYRDRDDIALRGHARTLGIAGVVAIACYLPWAFYIRSQPGAIGGWSVYFAKMLRINWFGNVYRHAAQQEFLSTTMSRAAVPFALLMGMAVHPGSWRISTGTLARLTVASIAAALIGGSMGAAVVACIAIAPMLLARRRIPDSMLLAWLALWVVMAPLYQPYFRLLLPFCLAVYIGAGCWLAQQLTRESSTAASPSRLRALSGAAVATALVLLFAPRLRPSAANPWKRGDTLRNVAQQMLPYVPAGARVTVIGEPALAFALHRAGRQAFERGGLADLDTVRSTGYIVTGVYTQRAPDLRDRFARLRPSLDSITSFHVDPNDLRLLDDMRKPRAFRAAPTGEFDVALFRIRTSPALP